MTDLLRVYTAGKKKWLWLIGGQTTALWLEIKSVAIQAIDILSQDRVIYKDLGLKRLKGDFWELRKGLKARILFRWEGDLVEFILAGDHNDIHRYLKNI